MAACNVCGAGVSEGAVRCSSCGSTLSGPDGAGASGVDGGSGSPTTLANGVRPGRRVPVKSIAAGLAALVVLSVVVAVVAVPRLYPSADPQKFVGTWVYGSGAPGQIVIARTGQRFAITFRQQDGTAERVPGVMRHGRLVLDYVSLSGQAVQRLAEQFGTTLSFAYHEDGDKLLLRTGSATQDTATIELRRAAAAAQ